MVAAGELAAGDVECLGVNAVESSDMFGREQRSTARTAAEVEAFGGVGEALEREDLEIGLEHRPMLVGQSPVWS